MGMITSLESVFIDLKFWAVSLLGQWLPRPVTVLVEIGLMLGALFAVVLGSIMYMSLMERKVLGRLQDRYGPNRVGPLGLLQPIADGLKLIFKEDIVPEGADRLAHFLAPVLMVFAALFVYAVIPFGRGMVLADIHIGILFFLGVSSMATVAAVTAGWGSHNKFSILGGMRSAALIISYEVPMVLSLVGVAMMAGSLSVVKIAEAQSGWHWFVLTPWGFAGCAIFFVSAMAELNRSPFDLLEAESELVAGYHTEYSGIKFALFYMAEYISLLAVCLLTTFLFLGGGDGPFLPSWFWMAAKTFVLIFIFMWVRGTLPRFRIDHLMAFSWKFLLPLALLNIFLAGLWFFLPWPLWGRNLLGFFLLAVSALLLSRRSPAS